MKSACIDTHALIWYLSRPARLGRAATRFLRDASAGRAAIFVPAAVGIELSFLREAGRRTVGVLELEALVAASPSFAFLPLDLAQAKEFALLQTLGDPFDRMVVAAARVIAAPLITADQAIHQSALAQLIWD